jgi:hypothetical protein
MINHIINKQVIDLRLPHKEGAWLLQQQMKELYQNELLNVLDQQFSKIAGDDDVLRIDKLEIDLGIISKDKLAEFFREKLNELLPERIAELKAQAVVERNKPQSNTNERINATPASSQKELEQTSLTEQFVSLLDHFFTTGNLPWWGNSQQTPISIIHVFERALRDESILLRSYIQRWIQRDAALKRIILQIPSKFDPLIVQLLCETRIATGVSDFLKAWNYELLNDSRFKNDPVLRRIWLYKTSAILANPVIALHRVATETETVRIQTAFLQAGAEILALDVQQFEINVYRQLIKNTDDYFIPEPLVSWLILWEKREADWVKQFSGGEQRVLDLAVSICQALPVALIAGQSPYERVQHLFKKINTDSNRKFEQKLLASLSGNILKKAANTLFNSLRFIRKESSTTLAGNTDATKYVVDDQTALTQSKSSDNRIGASENVSEKRSATQTSSTDDGQLSNSGIQNTSATNEKKNVVKANETKTNTIEKRTSQKTNTPSDTTVENVDDESLLHNTNVDTKQSGKSITQENSKPLSDKKQGEHTAQIATEKATPESKRSSAHHTLVEESKTPSAIQQRLSSWIEEVQNDPFSKSWETPSNQPSNTSSSSSSYTSDPIPFFADEPEEAQTQWAGLVLLAPFLQMFFNNLQLTGDLGFIDVAAQEKAVFILHYAACKKTKAEEHELALHKLLCGLPIDYPLPASKKLTKDEKQETNDLLDAVASQWTSLHTESGQAIRQSFLRRNGLIRKQDGAWLVRIERESIDILIDSLPWGFSIIKTGWMQQLIQVEW